MKAGGGGVRGVLGDRIMVTEYPDDADGDALRRLVASGADMSKPMDIDFFIAAADEATAKVVADKATELGYRTEICFDDDEGLVDPWTCECTKSMVPTYQAVIAAQAELGRHRPSLGCPCRWMGHVYRRRVVHDDRRRAHDDRSPTF